MLKYCDDNIAYKKTTKNYNCLTYIDIHKKNQKISNLNEEIDYLDINNSNGNYIRKPAVYANNVYGKYGENA